MVKMDFPDKSITKIRLERGTAGLGFNIRGGVDIPHVPGDPGIFVSKIREDGAAYKDKSLEEGDKILEVNGNDLSHVTHNEAVKLFIEAGEVVHLTVHKGAEKVLLERDADVKAMNVSPAKPKGDNHLLFYLLGVLGAVGIFGYFFRFRFRKFRTS